MKEETKDRIVDTAQALFFSRGYASTSIAEIISLVDIAKGTFYHHFSSKGELLDEIVRRFTEDILAALQPILDDPELNAEEKLRRYLVQGFAWKVADTERFFTLLNVLYTDENLLLRKKMTQRSIAIVAPILGRIVRQGVEEGIFDTPIPERAGELALRLSTALGDDAANLFARLPEDPGVVVEIDRVFAELEYGMERLIGAPEGTITMLNRDDLRAVVGAVSAREE